MTAPGAPHIDRIDELLADRAVQGLDDTEARELDRLLSAATGRVDPESFELAAAAAYLALAGPAVEPMPESISNRVRLAARSRLDTGRTPPGREAGLEPPASMILPPRRTAPSPVGAGRTAGESRGRGIPTWIGYTGWAAAAALLIVAAAWWPGAAATGNGENLSPAAMRERLLAGGNSDVIRVSWVNPADGSTQPGDVVWDNQRQEGYMRLASLPVNDPSTEQYQLWIIDPAHEHPIDGGVFDITQSGECIVPIDAKLRVSQPAAFAVTIEKPGGVVVSKRERLPLLAAVN